MTYFRLFLIVLSFSIVSHAPAFAGFDEAKKAYDAKQWLPALAQLRPLAESGHTEAQLLLANMYSDGSGVRADYSVALDLYTKSSLGNNNTAMLALAVIYAGARGVDKDLETAVYWFTEASKRNNPAAQLILATLYYKGDPAKTVSPDPLKSYEWYLIASQQKAVPEIQKASKKIAKLIANKLSKEEANIVKERVATWTPITTPPTLPSKKSQMAETINTPEENLKVVAPKQSETTPVLEVLPKE